MMSTTSVLPSPVNPTHPHLLPPATDTSSDCSLPSSPPPAPLSPTSSSATTLTSTTTTTTTSSRSHRPKTFVCSVPGCRKPFSKKWNMQAHMRLHTGSTPFACRLGCGASYMWMSSRKGHELNRCRFAAFIPPELNPSRRPSRYRRSANSAKHSPTSKTASPTAPAPASAEKFNLSAPSATPTTSPIVCSSTLPQTQPQALPQPQQQQYVQSQQPIPAYMSRQMQVPVASTPIHHQQFLPVGQVQNQHPQPQLIPQPQSSSLPASTYPHMQMSAPMNSGALPVSPVSPVTPPQPMQLPGDLKFANAKTPSAQPLAAAPTLITGSKAERNVQITNSKPPCTLIVPEAGKQTTNKQRAFGNMSEAWIKAAVEATTVQPALSVRSADVGVKPEPLVSAERTDGNNASNTNSLQNDVKGEMNADDMDMDMELDMQLDMQLELEMELHKDGTGLELDADRRSHLSDVTSAGTRDGPRKKRGHGHGRGTDNESGVDGELYAVCGDGRPGERTKGWRRAHRDGGGSERRAGRWVIGTADGEVDVLADVDLPDRSGFSEAFLEDVLS